MPATSARSRSHASAVSTCRCVRADPHCEVTTMMNRVCHHLLTRAVLLGAVAATAACTSKEEPRAAATQTPAERGAYLVAILGCHDCHSPKVFTEKGEPMPD